MKQLLILLSLLIISKTTLAHPTDEMSIFHIGVGTIIKINSPINVPPNVNDIQLLRANLSYGNCHLMPDAVVNYDRVFQPSALEVTEIESDISIPSEGLSGYNFILVKIITKNGTTKKVPAAASIWCRNPMNIGQFKQHFSDVIFPEPIPF